MYFANGFLQPTKLGPPISPCFFSVTEKKKEHTLFPFCKGKEERAHPAGIELKISIHFELNAINHHATLPNVITNILLFLFLVQCSFSFFFLFWFMFFFLRPGSIISIVIHELFLQIGKLFF